MCGTARRNRYSRRTRPLPSVSRQAAVCAYVAETRQVFDLPTVTYEVTEHRAMRSICSCVHVHTGEFPDAVNATVQYGPRAQAAMVHLNQNHAVSVQCTAALAACRTQRLKI